MSSACSLSSFSTSSFASVTGLPSTAIDADAGSTSNRNVTFSIAGGGTGFGSSTTGGLGASTTGIATGAGSAAFVVFPDDDITTATAMPAAATAASANGTHSLPRCGTAVGAATVRSTPEIEYACGVGNSGDDDLKPICDDEIRSIM